MTKLRLSDCIQGTAPGAEVGPSTILLRHPGDTVVLICPENMSKVSFHVAKVTNFQWRGNFGVVNNPWEQTNEKENITLTTGETKSYGPVIEQVKTDDNGLRHKWIENMDYTITLTGAEDLEGADAGLDNTPITYTWEITVKGEVVASGSDTDKGAADAAMTAAGVEFKDVVFSYIIKDGEGNTVKSGVHRPGGGGGDMSWIWWLLGIAAVGIFAAVVWRYFIAGKVIGGVQMPGPFIKGKPGQPQPAAAAPAPTAAPVVVVK